MVVNHEDRFLKNEQKDKQKIGREKLYNSLFHICKLKKIERIQSYYTFPYLSYDVM